MSYQEAEVKIYSQVQHFQKASEGQSLHIEPGGWVERTKSFSY